MISAALPATASFLTNAERNPTALEVGGTLAQAVSLFQRDPDLRLLPVLDRRGCPQGAIFEKDVRRLLLNPFGHALLQNPSINSEIGGFLRSCPTLEVTSDIARLVEHYHRCDGREGMILTRSGRLYATISNRRLLMLAIDAQQSANAARLARAARIEDVGGRFEQQIAALSAQMIGLANSVQRLAEATVDRAQIAGSKAAAVASAASQTRNSMGLVAERGAGLAAAFGQIEHSLARSRASASDTVMRVGDGVARSHRLVDGTRVIDEVMSLVGEIASKVNLLSLNASIEAARAGKAGAGFAVVAAEIRALSDQTQQATESLSDDVKAMREGLGQMASDFVRIEQAITGMAESSSEIDRAITSEADTTRLFAHTVSEARQASAEIEQAVGTIVQSVRSAAGSARELDSMANDLRRGAQCLGDEVGDFLRLVRAA